MIGSGSLDCHRTDGEGEKKLLKTYAPGEFFGELALLYNAPRAATVVAKEACTLYSLDRETFNAIVKELAAKRRETFDNALKQVKILDSVSAYERQQIADAIRLETFKAGDVIIREGEEGNTFYMVMEGEAKAVKGGAEVLKYKAGDYFGERALLKNEPRAATIEVTSEQCKLMMLDRKSFNRMLGPIDEILMRNMENYKTFHAQ